MNADALMTFLFTVFAEPFTYTAGIILCFGLVMLIARAIHHVGK